MSETGDSGREMLVIGLDPGSRCTGYGLVSERSGRLALVDCGTIRTDSGQDLSLRLEHIFTQLCRVISAYSPQEAAVEDVFVARNSSSALKLGQARGAVLVACSRNGLRVHTYEPNLVKKNLVGQGKAAKSQVAFMVQRLLGVSRPDWPEDCSDALAVAVSHLNVRQRARRIELAGGR